MSKFEDFGRAIDEEFTAHKHMIYILQEELDKEKNKRLAAANRLREFASWLEMED